jgi:hypothetical protein
MRVDGSTPGQGDLFDVSGTATINGASLTFTTDNQTPKSGNIYTFLTAGGGISGTGWGSLNYLGFDASYIFLTPGQLKEL